MNILNWSLHFSLLSGLALAASGCSDAATDAGTADTAVGDSHTPVPDSLGPIGAPTRPFFLRVDGGLFTQEKSPLLAPDAVGGFYAAGLVREEPQHNRDELWTARFDAGGVPLWHSVREGPRTASEQLRDLDTLSGDAVVLAAQLGTGYADPPFLPLIVGDKSPPLSR